jgi:hypothetical protein
MKKMFRIVFIANEVRMPSNWVPCKDCLLSGITNSMGNLLINGIIDDYYLEYKDGE